MLGRFHRGWAVPALSRSGRGAVICFGAVQRLTFMLLRFMVQLGGSLLGGDSGVARLLRLTGGDLTGGHDTRRPGRDTGTLTAG